MRHGVALPGEARASVVELRRRLHRLPELAFAERETQRLVRTLVEGLGPARDVGGTGLVVDLGPRDAPRGLLLRADMDGLPVTEATGLPFASVHPGRMHACGHDAHMAALIVAGRLLAADMPPGLRVRLLFQPAEEGAGGAEACVTDGALEGMDAAFGLHVWNELPLGTVALPDGGVMAAVVELTVVVRGAGGHAAMPSRSRSPVPAAAALVGALHALPGEVGTPGDPVVVTVGAIQGGDAFNVIPDAVTLRGTVRAMSAPTEARLEERVRALAAGVAAAHGVHADVTWVRHCGPTVNDPAVAGLARAAAPRVEGVDAVRADYRTSAGEDFGALAERLPAAFALVGAAPPPPAPPAPPHHSPRFDVDERVLPLAVGLHLAVARDFAARTE